VHTKQHSTSTLGSAGSSSFGFLPRKSNFTRDINCSNFFLDKELNLKLGDFAGSTIDGFPATICYNTTHGLPAAEPSDDPDGVIITKETEILAFGSTMYETMTGHPPLHDKPDSEVECLFRARALPDVEGFTVTGPVIKNVRTSNTVIWKRCWKAIQ
jgi:serine/threonine protein kinase